MPKNGKDILSMSDEDFMNNPPDFDDDTGGDPSVSSSGSDPEGVTLSSEAGESEGNQGNEDTDPEDNTEGAGTDDGQGNEGDGDDDPDASDADPNGDADDDDPEKAAKTVEGDVSSDTKNADGTPKDAQSDGKKADDGKPAEGKGTEAKPEDAGKDGVKAEEKPVDYQAFYKEVMKPFKANGREIKLNSPDEAIRLMQMGAGFGRKLQDLQPYLKTVRMLEKNGLLDEGKLSFLIDVNQKNPDAIKKLLKDSGIDPLDLNMEDNAEYKPRNHGVTDAEMAFQDALQDVQSHPTGKETIRHINKAWDQESKSLLWESPGLLKVIQSQRETGVYDQISAEIDRQKMLGDIPPNTPFIRAYKMAGDTLVRNAGLTPPSDDGQPQNALPGAGGQPSLVQSFQQPQPRVLATRASAPKAQAANNDKARAAATPQSTPRKSAQNINPLEMADEDFLKQFEGRL